MGKKKRDQSFYPTPTDIDRKWYKLNAEDMVLGRLSTLVASILMGKNKAGYTPSVDMGDYVIIYNASKVKVTGKKANQKIYYKHSRYPGGLKETVYKDMLEKKPNDVIQMAVKGMIPHNRLGRQMVKKLKVFSGEMSGYDAQNPIELNEKGAS